MIYSSKRNLSSDEYSKYNISESSDAYEFKFDHIIEERSYDIESDFLDQGMTIYHDELIPVSINVYNYIVIAST